MLKRLVAILPVIGATSAWTKNVVRQTSPVEPSGIYPQTPNGSSTNLTTQQLLLSAAYWLNVELDVFSVALNFSAETYEAQGHPSWVRGRVSQIYDHLQVQRSFLSASLGEGYPQPCTYNNALFNDTDSVLAIACGVEQISSSMYMGFVKIAQDEVARKTFGSMLGTAARHNAWIYASIFSGPPWTGPFDSFLEPAAALSFANVVTTSCPEGNPPLPFKLSPLLVIAGATGYDGAYGPQPPVLLSWEGSNQTAGPLYAHFANGLGATTVPLPANHTVDLPFDAVGWTFATITSESDPYSLSSNNTVAGPSYVHINFPSSASNLGWNNPSSIANVTA